MIVERERGNKIKGMIRNGIFLSSNFELLFSNL